MSLNTAQPQLFDLLEKKLSWIDTRQRVVAQNIANVDTPGYVARDVPAFAAALDQFDVEPVRTSPLHLAGYAPSSSSRVSRPKERAPDGNAVGLEDQLTKVADDEGAQALTGNLWKAYMGMFMTALGHG
jgi:flagellar basal-body rod protein FlgB